MTTTNQLQASRPALGDAEGAAVQRVLASGYLGSGPETRAFESELAAFFGGAMHVVTASTGTSALHLAVEALGLGAGDEVLVPSLTFVASFQAVLVSGARAIACDVRRADGLLDLADAARRITPRTRAVMPVHYAGHAGDLEAVHAFAATHGLRVIEDAAHAFGGTHRGRPIGAFGDVVAFSFDPIKNITCGQGGALCIADAAVAMRARAMRDLGLQRGRGPDGIEVEGPGWRYALPDLNAAIGRVQLARFAGELRPHRVALARHYRERLAGMEGVVQLESSEEAVPHIFVVRISGGRRDAVRAHLASAGIEAIVHYPRNHRLAAFAGDECPCADALQGELLTLPLHHGLSLRDVDRVVATLGNALGH